MKSRCYGSKSVEHRDIGHFGALLAQRRCDVLMTQSVLACALGISPETIARWEAEREPVPAAMLNELAYFLCCAPSDFASC